jgi:hypothetical protein
MGRSSRSSSSACASCCPIARSRWISTRRQSRWLAEKGYDPAYGARPLKRVIQKELQDPLAEKILAGEIPDGTVVRLTGGTDRLLFEPSEPVERAA